METTKTFKYKLDLTDAQASALWSCIGGSRFAYNHMLGAVKDNWAQIRLENLASGDDSHATKYLGTSQFDFVNLWKVVRDDVAP